MVNLKSLYQKKKGRKGKASTGHLCVKNMNSHAFNNKNIQTVVKLDGKVGRGFHIEGGGILIV